MKLVLPGIHEVINIKEENVNSLVIENPKLLYQVIMDIKQQLDKKDGEAVLSIDNEVVEIHKNVELIIDAYQINLNSKTILTKVVDELYQRAVNECNYEKTMNVMAAIQNYMDDLIWDTDCEVACSTITSKQIIKAVDLYVVDDEQELTVRILKYVELIRKFVGDKLFVFVNLRSFIGQEDFTLLAQTLIEHGFRVFFIDNKSYPIIFNEKRLTIDIDLCEF